MDERTLEELHQMKLEERWRELLADADDAIRQEEERIERKMSQGKDKKDRANEE